MYIGKPNLGYSNENDSDTGVNVRPGMEVIKTKKIIHRDLESVIHAVFDKEKEYFVIQRKDLLHAE